MRTVHIAIRLRTSPAGASGPIGVIYKDKGDASLRFLGEVNEPNNVTRIFEIQP